MAVIIGSARIDENGRAHGGKAGDQTGKEVSTQNWYKHSKGWVVLRAKDPKKAAKIAQAMRAACANDNIGYDQYQNQTHLERSQGQGLRPGQGEHALRDGLRAAGARVLRLCRYHGEGFLYRDRSRQADGHRRVREIHNQQIHQSDDYLGAGDILVTKTKGHTVVVLTNGSKYDGEVEEPSVPLGSASCAMAARARTSKISSAG